MKSDKLLCARTRSNQLQPWFAFAFLFVQIQWQHIAFGDVSLSSGRPTCLLSWQVIAEKVNLESNFYGNEYVSINNKGLSNLERMEASNANHDYAYQHDQTITVRYRVVWHQ